MLSPRGTSPGGPSSRNTQVPIAFVICLIELLPGSGKDDAAAVNKVDEVRAAARKPYALLAQQHRATAAFADLKNVAHELLDDHWRESFGGFVKEHQAWI